MLFKILLFSIYILLLQSNIVFAVENTENIEICYNYGCYVKQNISISNADINYIQNTLFADNSTSEIERENTIKAIAFLYKVAAKHTPIFRDVAGNYNDPANGKMDCIDHSTNTFTFLKLLAKYKLLKFHQIGQIETHYFLHLIPSHYAVSISEINNNKIYIIDSWYSNIFQDELPKIIDIRAWKNNDIELKNDYIY